MFSQLRNGVVYRNTSTDIQDHDEEFESDLWNYDGRDVYRGSFDPTFVNQNLHVYSLYNEHSKRIGIAEHELDAPEVFKALWFYDTPFGTLYQNPNWKSKNTTLWSLLSNEAYQDCLESDFKDVRDRALQSGTFLMTPDDCISLPVIYQCEKCNKKSFFEFPCGIPVQIDLSIFVILFVDEEFVLYERPTSSLPSSVEQASEEHLELQEHLRTPQAEALPEPATPPYPQEPPEDDQSHHPHPLQRYHEPSYEPLDKPEHSADAT